MNKRLLAGVFLAVGLLAVFVLVFFIGGYQETEFYLLGEGTGQYTQRELFFFPDSQEGQGLFVAPSGQLIRCERLSWDVDFAEGEEAVSYYLYQSKIFPVGEEYVNFYGGNSGDSFVAVKNGRKYLVNVSADYTRPLFEGSTLIDPYGEGVDGISAGGTWCGGIRDGVLELWKLQKNSFAPEEQKTVTLAQQGYGDPVFLRFINDVHLWFEAEKNGVRGGFLLDCTSGEVMSLPALPRGFSTERSSRLWHVGTAVLTEEGAFEQEIFQAISGVRKTVSVSSREFSSLEILSVSPQGSYVAVKLEREGAFLFGVYELETKRLTLMDGAADRMEFASEQALFVQTAEGYRVIRIVH